MYISPLLTILLVFFISIIKGFGQTIQSLQISPELAAHSDKWGIDINGKQSDIRLSAFGPYTVTKIDKLDSGAFKSKVKEDKEGSYDSKDGYDEYKIRRIEKNTIFRMSMTGESDSTETVFSAFTATRKKTETVLGAILSKSTSTGGSEILNERKQAEGMIIIKNDPTRWSFFIDYPSSSSNVRVISSGISGYLTNGSDTINMKVLYSIVSKKNKDSSSPDQIKMRMPRGVSLINNNDEQIAALVFKQTMAYIGKKSDSYTNDDMVMINKDMDKPVRLAIASLYAIMIGFQGY